jgi:hypothetical protein
MRLLASSLRPLTLVLALVTLCAVDGASQLRFNRQTVAFAIVTSASPIGYKPLHLRFLAGDASGAVVPSSSTAVSPPEVHLSGEAPPSEPFIVPFPPVTAGFWVGQWGLGKSAASRFRVVAELRARTRDVDLWVDRDMPSNVDLLRRPGDAIAMLVKARFITERHFGSLRSPWGSQPRDSCSTQRFLTPDGKMRVLVVAPGKLPENYADIDSYIRPACWKYSNGTSGLMILDTTQFANYGPQGLLISSAHEAQHLESYVRHDFWRDAWFMNEGLSELAQDLSLGDDPGLVSSGKSGTRYFARRFLQKPELYDLFAQPGDVPKGVERPDYLGSYGSWYLLQRFLYDTYGEVYLDHLRQDAEHLGLTELERATSSSSETIEVAFARALWTGIGKRSGFDAMREACEKLLGPTFLDVRPAVEGSVVDLPPGSISYWETAGPIPQVVSDDPAAHVVVVKLPAATPSP